MSTNQFIYTAQDDTPLTAYSCLSTQVSTRGCVLIVHGMMDHAQRYTEFACHLSRSGYHVFAYDQRGHGDTGATVGLGHLDHTTTWDTLVSDCNEMIAFVHKAYPNLPLTLFGHSMGSFIAMNTLIDYSHKAAANVTSLILSGSCYEPLLDTCVGACLSRLFLSILPGHTKGVLFHWIIFTRFNAAFSPNRTASDWISRDTQKVDSYINDPKAGFNCSIRFFNVLFRGLNTLFRPEKINKLPHVPILVLSGGDDPMPGKGLKKLHQLIAIFENNGHTDLTTLIYPEGRHSMINEINRSDVYCDVVTWLDTQLDKHTQTA